MPGNNEKDEEMRLDPTPFVLPLTSGELRTTRADSYPDSEFKPRPEYSQDWRDYR